MGRMAGAVDIARLNLLALQQRVPKRSISRWRVDTAQLVFVRQGVSDMCAIKNDFNAFFAGNLPVDLGVGQGADRHCDKLVRIEFRGAAGSFHGCSLGLCCVVTS